MQPIPETVSSTHNDTTQQILSAEGLLWALDEILNESDIENTPEARWNAIFALVRVVKTQVDQVRESHEAEWRAWSALPESKRTEALAHPRAPSEADEPQTQARANAGRSYPRGSRLLFWLHRRTGLGIHELYVFRPVRWAVNLLDR